MRGRAALPVRILWNRIWLPSIRDLHLLWLPLRFHTEWGFLYALHDDSSCASLRDTRFPCVETLAL